MKSLLKFTTLIALFGIGGCDYLGTFPKSIREFPEPWQVLEPGKPAKDALKIEVVEAGHGPKIDEGDLVEIHMKTFWGTPEKTWRDRGSWWLWIGFRSKADTPFYDYLPRATSSLVGLNQGTSLRFLEAESNWISAGKLRTHPLGDPEYYSWRKNVREFWDIYVPTESGYSLIEIERVCKGQAKYRTVRLFDDSPVQICSGANCRVSRGISEAWVEEARIDAVCQDGKKASFQYGPVGDRGHSSLHGYFDRWFLEAWDKLPVGVQLK